jgi:hypothetical protein
MCVCVCVCVCLYVYSFPNNFLTLEPIYVKLYIYIYNSDSRCYGTAVHIIPLLGNERFNAIEVRPHGIKLWHYGTF